jgi:ribosomal protein L37AE/L43A
MKKINAEKFQDLIKNGGVSFTETPSSFLFICPKCGKKKLAVHKQLGFWSCYKCKSDGFKGRPENIINILYETPIQQAVEAIYDNLTTKLQEKIYLKLHLIDPWADEISEPVDYSAMELPEVYLNPLFVDRNSPLFEPGRRYLIDKRGLTEDHIEKYGILYNPSTLSVVFPVKFEEKVYGWQERSIKDNIKRTMKGFERQKALMFMDSLKDSDHAIITEGPIDALKCSILGGAVCTMGKAVTEHQIKMIVERVERVYIALDHDASKEKNELCKKIAGIREVFVMTPPPDKDFGACTEQEVLESFANAVPYFGQKFLYLKNLYESR